MTLPREYQKTRWKIPRLNPQDSLQTPQGTPDLKVDLGLEVNHFGGYRGRLPPAHDPKPLLSLTAPVLTAQSETPNTVTLNWQSPSNAITHAILQNGEELAGYTSLPANTLSATLESVPGAVYAYQIVTRHRDGVVRSNVESVEVSDLVVVFPNGVTGVSPTGSVVQVGATVTINWSHNAANTDYIEISGSEGTFTTVAANATSFQVQAQAGFQSFTITPRNTFGSGPPGLASYLAIS